MLTASEATGIQRNGTTSNLVKICYPEQWQGQEKCDVAIQQEMTGGC